jgi:hypothetical protein
MAVLAAGFATAAVHEVKFRVSQLIGLVRRMRKRPVEDARKHGSEVPRLRDVRCVESETTRSSQANLDNVFFTAPNRHEQRISTGGCKNMLLKVNLPNIIIGVVIGFSLHVWMTWGVSSLMWDYGHYHGVKDAYEYTCLHASDGTSPAFWEAAKADYMRRVERLQNRKTDAEFAELSAALKDKKWPYLDMENEAIAHALYVCDYLGNDARKWRLTC